MIILACVAVYVLAVAVMLYVTRDRTQMPLDGDIDNPNGGNW